MVLNGELITHRLPETSKMRGAISILSVLLAMMIGPCVPPALALMALVWPRLAVTLGLGFVGSMALARHSPDFCCFYLRAAGWFEKGVFLHMEREALEAMRTRPTMWCMHPHGTAIGFGFTLNGAIRFRADDDDSFVPETLSRALGAGRMRICDGVQAPVLFKIPIVRNVLKSFGCATPATKEGMTGLFRRQIDFGILPGGMEEVALYAEGKERIYLRKRVGFIKYALQHGYTLTPGYTFGESDCYSALTGPLSTWIKMITLKRGGFVIPAFWGPLWWMPLLPRFHSHIRPPRVPRFHFHETYALSVFWQSLLSHNHIVSRDRVGIGKDRCANTGSDVAIHTVVGQPVLLPKIADPTAEQIRFWHAAYVESVQTIFDTYKARFGYGDRTLEIF